MSKTAAKMSEWAAVGKSIDGRGIGSAARVRCVAAHAKSDISHRPGAIFAEAAGGYVLLQQRGKGDFVLVAESLLGSELRIGEEAGRVLALVSAPVEQYPNLPGFAWTATLPEAERREMRDELVLGLRRAVEGSGQTPDARWRAYDQAVYEWRATAEALADPEQTARLLAEWSEKDEVVLARP